VKHRSLIKAAAALLSVGAIAAVAIGSASAKTSTLTLHFFQKGVSFRLTDAAGNPLPTNAIPTVGSVFDASDVDYVGNHKHHAKKSTASDHIRCVFETVPTTPTGTATLLCDGAIAIGGSMLLADHSTAAGSQSSTTVQINGGVGKYKGYHGTATSTSIGNTNNSDLVVKIHK
jgi:hypothetical protein